MSKNAKNGTQKKTHGVGAIVSALNKFLHPSTLIREKYPNPKNCQRLEGCKMLQQEVKKINQKDQLSLVITHEDFLDANGNLHELYAVKKHFGIQEERDPDFSLMLLKRHNKSNKMNSSLLQLTVS